MKLLKKILKWGGIGIVTLVALLAVYVQVNWQKKFDAPYPELKASSDPEVIKRGEYLVYGPAHCGECHINNDEYPRAIKGEKLALAGGFEFKLPLGSAYSKNISTHKEHGIGKYSDAEIARVLRYGVKPDGTALIDFMPFYNASDADIIAIISYLRTLPANARVVPPNKWNFLGKALMAFVIKPVGPTGTPPKSVRIDSTAEYGKYLANSIANCRGCHTNRDLTTGAFIGPDYAGGLKMESATGEANVFCVTPNITTDETGVLKNFDEQTFINRFRKGKLIPESIMPWGPFSNFSDADLKAIYAYLQTVNPVKNETGPVVLRETK